MCCSPLAGEHDQGVVSPDHAHHLVTLDLEKRCQVTAADLVLHHDDRLGYVEHHGHAHRAATCDDLGNVGGERVGQHEPKIRPAHRASPRTDTWCKPGTIERASKSYTLARFTS